LIDSGETCPSLWAISSNLVEDQAINACYAVLFDPSSGSGWTTPMMYRVVPLPTQDCCCHRLEIVHEGLPPEAHSVVVSELSTSKLWQMKLQFSLGYCHMLVEEDQEELDDEETRPEDAEPLADGAAYEVRKFHEMTGISKRSGQCSKAIKIKPESEERLARVITSFRAAASGDGVMRWGKPDAANAQSGIEVWNSVMQKRKINDTQVLQQQDAKS